jgi:hypothetical protein
VVIEELLGPADAFRLIVDALGLYRQLRRGELLKG